ncbi:hypothetical protein [Actinophytocola sp. NPDC049390]|uniref:hypothetical protein n=1 Tax=Actinophytocola sp. NPDC049390 TaxID=3363894 RepID=UPI0037B6F67E
MAPGYGGWQQPQVPPPGWPPQPPTKARTGLIVGVVLALVVVLGGGFAVTAFVAPGFLLEDSENPAGRDSAADANTFVDAVLADLNAGKAEPVLGAFCDPQTELGEAKVVGLAEAAELRRAGDVSDSLTVDVMGTVNDKPIDDESSLYLDSGGSDGDWCIAILAVSAPLAEVAEALPTAQEIASEINNGDVGKVVERACTAHQANLLRKTLPGDVANHLTVHVGEARGSSGVWVEFFLSGQLDGEAIDQEGSYLAVESQSAGKSWCIRGLIVRQKF